MMFEAILFLASAVLFFLSVLFFVFLWQDRLTLARRSEALQVEVSDLKEQRVELDIREHELLVWDEGLEHQQKALEQAQEELRMLTASKQVPEPTFDIAPSGEVTRASERAPRAIGGEPSVLKNVKQKVKLDQ
ncbi:MAG: hypothetical protein J7M39_05600 [Anaerolineae bacterium]|nr:hypothetical protein [Anaerolineae bacterium]